MADEQEPKDPEWWEAEGKEPLGWKVTEEEKEKALKKLWAGLEW